MGMRILLLLTISWIIGLTQPLVQRSFGRDFSWRDVILIGGGLFLLWKATTEIHESLEGAEAHESTVAAGTASFGAVLVQIVLLDIVFSLDSVLTAVGMADDIAVMVAAVVIACRRDAGRVGAVVGLRAQAPDGQDAGAVVPAPDRRDADRRRVRVPHRQGVHLRGDGVQRLRRGAQPATPQQASRWSSTRPS